MGSHIRTWLTVALVLVVAYAFGFVVFVSRIPSEMKPIGHADGIVALTGGDVRLMAAETLFEGKVGKRLLISGVHPGTTKNAIKKLVNGGPRFDCCADMGFQATNTRGNALEAGDWAREHDYHSLVVVTANYHMPRSLIEFADVMPNVKLMPYPVQQADVDPQAWWSNGHVFRVLQGEYIKYLGSLFVTTLFRMGFPTIVARKTIRDSMTLFRSTLFFIWFVLATVILNLGFLPALLLPRRAAVTAGRTWAAATLWGLRIFAGLKFEVRGTPPHGAVLVASKHMSMWDTLALYVLLDAPMIVLKRELLNIPFYGWYARKAGVIAIDRDGRASALRRMAADAKMAYANGNTVMIFPEGHRQPPGAVPDYKPGVAALYGQFGGPCVPVALDSGLFWTGPGGFLKKSGTIVVEFLPAIPPGLKRAEFMSELQTRIETATAALVDEGRKQLAG